MAEGSLSEENPVSATTDPPARKAKPEGGTSLSVAKGVAKGVAGQIITPFAPLRGVPPN